MPHTKYPPCSGAIMHRPCLFRGGGSWPAWIVPPEKSYLPVDNDLRRLVLFREFAGIHDDLSALPPL